MIAQPTAGPVNIDSEEFHPLLAALLEPGTTLVEILERFKMSLRSFHNWVTSASTQAALKLVREIDTMRGRAILRRAITIAYSALAEAAAVGTEPEKRRRAADSILREAKRLAIKREQKTEATEATDATDLPDLEAAHQDRSAAPRRRFKQRKRR